MPDLPVQISLTCRSEEAVRTRAEFEAAARDEVERLVDLIRADFGLFERLGKPVIESLDRGGYLFRKDLRTVAVRPGLLGELHEIDPVALFECGTGPAIFVNIVECSVFMDRHTTQNNVLHELADQLKA